MTRRIGRVVVTPTGFANSLSSVIEVFMFETYKVINTFNFNQPVFKFLDLGVLFETVAECKLCSYTGFNSVVKLFSSKVGGGVTEKAVLCLDGHCEIPERHIALSHSEQFNTSDSFPVLGKVTLAEFDHEVLEGKSEEMVAMNGDPVLDASITEASQNLPDLLVRFNIPRIEVTKAGLLVFAHHGWCQISFEENRDLGWVFLFDTGRFGLCVWGGHD